MSSVNPGSYTYADIETKVRRLTASASQSTLSSVAIQQYVQTAYTQDFAYAVKIDQMRSVYTFFTEPYRDRYPLDVNFNQGVRAPVYIEGILGAFYKDRQSFYNVWPRFPTKFQPIFGDGLTTAFSFTIPGPFLSKEVVLGGVDSSGNPISVNDDGNGNLQLQVPNPVVSVPVQYVPSPTNPLPTAIPGMKNLNTLNPGLNNVNTQTLIDPLVPGVYYPGGIGTVNYVTGQFNITFPVAPANGSTMTLWVSQYQHGRPYSLLFWNNEFTIRPIPKNIHKIEVETYLTPVQFLMTNDQPILAQWWQCIAILAAIHVLEDRQDMEGVKNLSLLYDRQEALVLSRQAVEEINQPNLTMFNSPQQSYGIGAGLGGYGYF